MVSECMETSLPSKRESGQWEERDTHQGRGEQSASLRGGHSDGYLPPHTPLPSPLSFAL